MPYVSVIIPTLNRAGPLANVVRYFLEEEPFRDFELIIVDQSDEKNAALESLALTSPVPLRYLHVDFRQTTRARNLGVQHATGDVIVFSEDDVEPWSGILAVYSNYFFAHADAAGATGPVLAPGQTMRSRNDVSQTEFDALEDQSGMALDVSFPFWARYGAGGNSAYARSGILRANGFDENYVGNAWGEELEFGFRFRKLVGRIRYLPEAGVVHLAIPSGGSRNASMVAYVRDFVANTLYTVHQIDPGMVSMLQESWRCLRRLVVNRQTTIAKAAQSFVGYLWGILAAGRVISIGRSRKSHFNCKSHL